MLPRSFALLALTLACWLAGCSTPTTPATTAGADPGKPVQITALNGLFPKLERGMTAEMIRLKLGAPAEIKPMPSPDGHAEVWIYHFEKSVGMEQVATGTIDVPTFSTGASGPITSSAPQLTYSMVEKRAIVTLSLLLFNDQLAAQKAAVEDSQTYR